MSELSFWHWAVLVCLAALAWIIARETRRSRRLVCARCGTESAGVSVTRGSLAIELVLWLCLIVPGLVYSIWRLTTRATGCPACGASEMIPPDSPVARRLLGRP